MVRIPENDEQITVYLDGSRVTRGVGLSDFESFVDGFLAALRDFDRSRRGAPTKRGGHPERRAEAVMAFRLVGFREGSGIATIEPDIADEPDTLFEDLPAPTENLEAMLDAMERRELPEVVNEALTRACGALGTGGTIKVTSRQRSHPVMIDAERLAEMRPEARPTPPRATSISGRLHLVDVEPDRIGIRASSGIDWICDYPEELEELVTGLVGQIVWVAGEGEQTSARRGSMRIDEVRAVEQGDQSEFFTWAPVDDAELMDRQGIREPQGLERVAEGGWDAETDQAYLDALTSG